MPSTSFRSFSSSSFAPQLFAGGAPGEENSFGEKTRFVARAGLAADIELGCGIVADEDGGEPGHDSPCQSGVWLAP